MHEDVVRATPAHHVYRGVPSDFLGGPVPVLDAPLQIREIDPFAKIVQQGLEQTITLKERFRHSGVPLIARPGNGPNDSPKAILS
jgi:hypothetical protein